jgi:molybdopterin-binding protein
MTQLRISEVAELLGVSDDTVRRMIEQGRLPSGTDDSGRRTVEGAAVAALARDIARPPSVGTVAGQSARNQLRGIVTTVLKDTVMAQVELQCGPFRIVSLMSREAVDELGLDVGSVAVASVKSTNVIVGIPA